MSSQKVVMYAEQVFSSQLSAFAEGYCCCLWAHCNVTSQTGRYLFDQAHWVRDNSTECVKKLLEFGHDGEFSQKHWQYFFAVLPPMYEPYMQLWSHVLCRLTEDGRQYDLPVDFFSKRLGSRRDIG